MSHVIAEEQKIRKGVRYYLNVSHSGGLTHAQITHHKNDKWYVDFKEDGKNAEEHALFKWARI